MQRRLRRDVFIQFKPTTHIADFYTKTPLEFNADGDLSSARLEVEVDVRGPQAAALEQMTVEASLYRWTFDGANSSCSEEAVLQVRANPVALWTAGDTSGVACAAQAAGAARATLSADVTSLPSGPVQLWTAERPALYILLLALKDASGTVLEYEASQVGFRYAALSGGMLLHNGRAIMLRGANRHEHDQRTGKTVSLASMVEDAMLMKRFNFNAVRCSHYPNNLLW